MQRNTRYLIGAGVVTAAVALAGAGAGALSTVGDDDGNEVPITGPALDAASAAAIAHTGGGRVTDTEVGDEEGYYEVEVTLDDGSQVDVHLDEDFSLIGSEDDTGQDDTAGEDDED